MIATAILMGFVGSLHCLGMCTPLVMAVTNLSGKAFLKRIVYNSGRIFVYGVLGLLVSGVGQILPIGPYQNAISLTLGIALLIIGLAGVSRIPLNAVPVLLVRLQSFLKNKFSKLIQRKTHASSFLMGSLNGILPCGLTFIALSYCVTLESTLNGFYFMLLFGAGTLPVMLGFTSLLQKAIQYFKLSFARVSTTMLVLSGLLLIARVVVDHNHSHPKESKSEADIVVCK